MTAPTRGSWNLDEAIIRHWADEGLDEVFRAYWDDHTDPKYVPLHHEMADPEPPGPYATYVIDLPTQVAAMTGLTSGEERQFLDFTVTFQIHAKTVGLQSGKVRARDIAKQVIAAFDPDKPLPICDDAWVQTRRGPDQALRLGLDDWSWICVFYVQLDAAYNR
jgi:hypothetical protein